MKYNQLIQFEPVETVIQLRDTREKEYSLQLLDTFVISGRMAEVITEVIIEQLQFEYFADNKGLLIVGNYGAGKSHLMSVIATIAEEPGVCQRLKNPQVAAKAKSIEGKFQVARSEIGASTMSLRDIICGELEDRLAELGVDYRFPPAGLVRNNKDTFVEMMAEFHRVYPDQGLLMVADELLEYLQARKEQDLFLDLGFLREIGEICKNTRFRFIAGIQEMLFDNPKFQFVAEQLRRVRERFEQVLIIREDIAYVVSQRLLKKTDRQKAMIREHLRQFTALYEHLNERIEEYVELFPIHPAYLATFERVMVAEKRVILKTISAEIRKIIDHEVPTNEPGLISYDSYWPYIEDDPALRTEPAIREVREKAMILQDRIENAMTKPGYRPLALRIVRALAVHRLTTGDIYARLGVTSTELRDTLFLYTDLPEPDGEFLRSTIESTLKEILKTVSWQYISFNEENGQYYLDLKKDIAVDDLIENKAEVLTGRQLDRYYFDALTLVMGCAEHTYVSSFRIWRHELPWSKKKVTRAGYLFFGAPNERSTAQPPRDFYIYMLQPYDPPKFKDGHQSDEVFFNLKERDEKLNRALSLYAGAKELSLTAAAGTKGLYEEKAEGYLKQVTGWLRENLLKAYEVTYKGTTRKMVEYVTDLPPQASVREMINLAAAACLTPWFEEKYPDYPHFTKLRSPMTSENLPGYVLDALRSIAGNTTRNGLALIDGLVLMEDEKLNVKRSGYARWVLEKLAAKAQGQVVNRAELIELLYTCQGTEDLEITTEFRMEPELLVVLLAALVYSGEIVITIAGVTYDAMKYDQLSRLPFSELKNFSYIKRPIGLPMPALKALFELFGVSPGLLHENSLDDGIFQALRQAQFYLKETIAVLQMIRTGIPCWEGTILSPSEQEEYQGKLEGFKEFLEGISSYNTAAKLRNFRYTAEEVAANQLSLDLVRQVKGLQQRVNDLLPLAHYLQIAEQHLPQGRPWRQQVEVVLEGLLQDLKAGQSTQAGAGEARRLKEEYQDLYLAMHAKARLNASQEQRKNALLSDERVAALQQLATIELLPERQLKLLLTRITALKTCWRLTKADLAQQTVCPHCRFQPQDEQYLRAQSIATLEEQADELLDAWTGMLISNINAPEVQESIGLLKETEQKQVRGLLAAKEFALPLDPKLLQTIKELLQGIERVEINVDDLAETLGSGRPLTVEEARAGMENLLQQRIGNNPPSKVRVVFIFPSEKQIEVEE